MTRQRLREALRHRASRVAEHLARVIADLNGPLSLDLEAHADFIEAAHSLLFPEPWLAFVECVHRATLDCERAEAAREGRGGARGEGGVARLTRQYFGESFPDLAERAWPRLEPGKNRRPLLDAATAWGRDGRDRQRWEAMREAVCCFHPDDPDRPRANAPQWESMDRQWRKYARHKFLPPRIGHDPHLGYDER